MRTMRIQELMTESPVTCGPDEALREAAKKMEDSDCGCLPVTAGNGSQRLVGIITDRDICMAAQIQSRSLEELWVRDAMTKVVYTCNPGDVILEGNAACEPSATL